MGGRRVRPTASNGPARERPDEQPSPSHGGLRARRSGGSGVLVLQRRVVLAMIKRRAAAASDVLPHVPCDGDHGVSVERGERSRTRSRSPGIVI